MAGGLKQFLLREMLSTWRWGVVVGAAFGAVVTELTKDLLTPLIAAIVGKPDFSNIQFTVNGSKFLFGNFINALVPVSPDWNRGLLLRGGSGRNALINRGPSDAEPRRLPDPDDQGVSQSASATSRSPRGSARSALRRSSEIG